MIMNGILLIAGLVVGKFKRANLLYLSLIVYAFSTANIAGIGISVYTVMNWLTIVPLFLFLLLDGVLLGGFRKKSIPKGIYISIAVLFLYILFRYRSSIHPDRFHLMITLATCFIVLVAGMFYFDQIKMDRILRIIKGLIVFEVVLVIGQSILGNSFTRLLFILDYSNVNDGMTRVESFYRATGTFGDPNYYALFLCVLSSTMLIKFKLSDKVIFLLGMLGVILSFSRMGMLICGLLLVVFVIKTFTVRNKLSIFYLGISISAVFLFLFFILNTTTGINSFITELSDNIRYRFLDIYDFGEGGRVYIIQSYFSNILNINNFILGLGFENFEGELLRATGQSLVAHNEYLQVFADIGLAGIGLIAVIVFMALKNTTIRLLVSKNRMFITLAVILVGNLFLMTTFNIYIYLFVALYVGCAFKKNPMLLEGGNA